MSASTVDSQRARVGLLGEGVVGGNLFAEMPVAGLELAAGQLADGSERTGSGHEGLLVLGANFLGTSRHGHAGETARRYTNSLA